MFRFINSLFSPEPSINDHVEAALLEKAIERVVDGTDPRLRGFSNYRKRLRSAVVKSISHVIQLADELPAASDLSQQAFGNDARLRAFFVSNDHLQDTLGQSRSLNQFLVDIRSSTSDEIFFLLAMTYQERDVLGTELHNGMVRRDVLQRSVNFSNHRYLGVTCSENDTRWEIKKRAFDHLISLALEQIVTTRNKRSELEQQHRLLEKKLQSMKTGHWGLESMLGETDMDHTEIGKLEAEIQDIEGQLGHVYANPFTLEHNFECITRVLDQPEESLSTHELTLHLDSMLIKTKERIAGRTQEIHLTQVESANGESRIILLVRLPTATLPTPADPLSQAVRYLG